MIERKHAAQQSDEDDNKHKRTQQLRAKQRWTILRQALLSKSHDTSNTMNPMVGNVLLPQPGSIHEFPGFQLLKRRVLEAVPTTILPKQQHNPHEYQYAEYILPRMLALKVEKISPSDNDAHVDLLPIRTRERIEASSTLGSQSRSLESRLKAMTSERHYDGVDNTGNARVWDCESTLTHCLLRQRWQLPPQRQDQSQSSLERFLCLDGILSVASAPLETSKAPKLNEHYARVLRVVELGCGMAGLAGLALLSLSRSSYLQHYSHDKTIQFDITLTDGHPDAVENNEVCVGLTKDHSTEMMQNKQRTLLGDDELDVQCQRLVWRADPQGAADCTNLLLTKASSNGNNTLPLHYNICLVSDCLHFQQHHGGLIATLGRLLDVKNGVAILCQPKRGDSQENFINLLEMVNGNTTTANVPGSTTAVAPLFDICLLEHGYDDEVERLHTDFLQKQQQGLSYYEEIRHYPNILILKKIRPYQEKNDTSRIIQCFEKRSKTKIRSV